MQPNLIQNPIVNERLSRFLGIKQGGNVAPQCAPELMPVVIVDDLSRTAKGGTTPHVRPWAARANITPVNFASIRVMHFQPSIQTTVQRILGCTICTPAATGQQITFELVAGVSAGVAIPDTQKAYVDSRLPGAPSIDIRTLDLGAAPSLLTQFFEERLQSNQVARIRFNNPILLSPGFVGNTRPNLLIVSCQGAAQGLSLTVEGEEEDLIG